MSNNSQILLPHRSFLQSYAYYIYKRGLYTASQLRTVGKITLSASQTGVAVFSAVALKAFGAIFEGMENYTWQEGRFADIMYKQEPRFQNHQRG